MATVCDFKVLDKQGQEVCLSQYAGKVLLIVNTASKCGFTPQYEELEKLYEKYSEQGFTVLDFPCNQFGEQAPGTDEEYGQFCQTTFGVKFPQFKKSEVNGENELALYTFLKEQKGFAGFDPTHKLTPILNDILGKADPNFAEKSDIKWNFTKFLISREGAVVARFEPTEDMAKVEAAIKELL